MLHYSGGNHYVERIVFEWDIFSHAGPEGDVYAFAFGQLSGNFTRGFPWLYPIGFVSQPREYY